MQAQYDNGELGAIMEYNEKLLIKTLQADNVNHVDVFETVINAEGNIERKKPRLEMSKEDIEKIVDERMEYHLKRKTIMDEFDKLNTTPTNK